MTPGARGRRSPRGSVDDGVRGPDMSPRIRPHRHLDCPSLLPIGALFVSEKGNSRTHLGNRAPRPLHSRCLLCRLRRMRSPSIQTCQVFQAMLDAPSEETYGFELVKATGLPSGSVYPILRRLEQAGLVTARQEVIDPSAPRPRYRVYYRLTGDGARTARNATRGRVPALRVLSPGWSGV